LPDPVPSGPGVALPHHPAGMVLNRTAPAGAVLLTRRSPMSAVRQLSVPVIAVANRSFTEALDRIDAVIAYQFRRWPRGTREEAMAEARAGCWVAWHGLLVRGLDPVAVGVTGIAANASRAVKNGRTVGRNRSAGRTAPDIQHPKARRAKGLRVFSIGEVGERSGAMWRDWLVAEGRYGPAEEAAFRIDFATWLSGLPARKREAAKLLAVGLGTCEVAESLGVTPAAISQDRVWLSRSWDRFQGEANLMS
jgi:hypothetical protein